MLPTFGVSARYGTYLAFGSGLHWVAPPAPIPPAAADAPDGRGDRDQPADALRARARLAARRPAARPADAARPHPRLRHRAAWPCLPGDPLLFHDFLPEPNPILLFDAPSRGGLGLTEEVSTHVAARGRLRDDLYVSRLPEVTLSGQIPLTRVVTPPADGDPRRSGRPCGTWSSTPTPRRRSATTASSPPTSTPAASAPRSA